jgi:hypothetical protein
MKQEWLNWIDSYPGQKILRSREVCNEMREEFSGLHLVQGYIDVGYGRPLHHWWLVSKEGEIVDPTTSQYPPILRYEEWDETSPPSSGRCLNCKSFTFDGSHFCNQGCEKQFSERMKNLNKIAGSAKCSSKPVMPNVLLLPSDPRNGSGASKSVFKRLPYKEERSS